jgi:acetyl esterase
MRRIGKVQRRVFPGIARMTPEQLTRAQSGRVPEALAAALLGSRTKGVHTEDRLAGSIPVRIYTPTAPAVAARPVVVYFHGGGFVFGDLRGGDWMCSRVCRHLDAIVVSVEYRLAPLFPFPAAVDDSYAGLTWATTHAAELGGDPTRLAVMGESAGGNLAAVCCLRARDEGGPTIRHQALLYPVVGDEDSESRRVNADAFILTVADMQRFAELYAPDESDWRAAPLVAESHRDLPPALIVVAGHDPLHDDGVRYAEALERAGGKVELLEYPAMPHGFMNFPRFARDATRALVRVVAAQRAALQPEPTRS